MSTADNPSTQPSAQEELQQMIADRDTTLAEIERFARAPGRCDALRRRIHVLNDLIAAHVSKEISGGISTAADAAVVSAPWKAGDV